MSVWALEAIVLLTLCAGGLLIGAWYALMRLFAAVPRLPGAPPAPQLPEQGPYRTADEPPPVNEPFVMPEAVGPYHNCPQCGAPAMRCDGCGTVRTDVVSGTVHKFDTTRCGEYVERPDVFLDYTHLTSPLRLCSPQQRVSIGWFGWLIGARCKKHGLHVHQMCDRCGWRGVAYVGRIPALHEP